MGDRLHQGRRRPATLPRLPPHRNPQHGARRRPRNRRDENQRPQNQERLRPVQHHRRTRPTRRDEEDAGISCVVPVGRAAAILSFALGSHRARLPGGNRRIVSDYHFRHAEQSQHDPLRKTEKVGRASDPNMQHVIFYSWQADRSNNTNRGFITAALEEAAAALAVDLIVEPRIDHDTQNVPGSNRHRPTQTATRGTSGPITASVAQWHVATTRARRAHRKNRLTAVNE